MANKGKATKKSKTAEEVVEESVVEEATQEQSSTPITTEPKAQILYFKLNGKKAGFWVTEDETITLSLPAATIKGIGAIYGSVNPSDQLNYEKVSNGINHALLIQVPKTEYDSNKNATDKLPIIDLNARIETQFAMDRKIESLLRRSDPNPEKEQIIVNQVLNYIRNQSDSSVIMNMMKYEETHFNRSVIIRELDVALRKADGSGMSSITQEAGGKYDFGHRDIETQRNQSK